MEMLDSTRFVDSQSNLLHFFPHPRTLIYLPLKDPTVTTDSIAKCPKPPGDRQASHPQDHIIYDDPPASADDGTLITDAIIFIKIPASVSLSTSEMLATYTGYLSRLKERGESLVIDFQRTMPS